MFNLSDLKDHHEKASWPLLTAVTDITPEMAKDPQWQWLERSYETAKGVNEMLGTSMCNAIVTQGLSAYTMSRDSMRELVKNDPNWPRYKKTVKFDSAKWSAFLAECYGKGLIELAVPGKGKRPGVYKVTAAGILKGLKVSPEQQQRDFDRAIKYVENVPLPADGSPYRKANDNADVARINLSLNTELESPNPKREELKRTESKQSIENKDVVQAESDRKNPNIGESPAQEKGEAQRREGDGLKPFDSSGLITENFLKSVVLDLSLRPMTINGRNLFGPLYMLAFHGIFLNESQNKFLKDHARNILLDCPGLPLNFDFDRFWMSKFPSSETLRKNGLSEREERMRADRTFDWRFPEREDLLKTGYEAVAGFLMNPDRIRNLVPAKKI